MNDESDKLDQGDEQELSGIHFLDDREACEFSVLENDDEFRKYHQASQSGLKIIAQKYRSCDGLLVSPEAGDFTKWLKHNHPDLNVDISKKDGILVLHSSDYWMPLVFLSSNIALPIYLNLVSSYIFERMKGALRNEKARVHLEAVYHDEKEGVSKKFHYEGDAEGLQKIIKKIDLNQFLDK